jgi:hypothetical protein
MIWRSEADFYTADYLMKSRIVPITLINLLDCCTSIRPAFIFDDAEWM